MTNGSHRTTARPASSVRDDWRDRKPPPTRSLMFARSLWLLPSWFVLLGVFVIGYRFGPSMGMFGAWVFRIVFFIAVAYLFWWYGLYGLACLIAAIFPGRSRDVPCPQCGSVMRTAPAAVEAMCGSCWESFDVNPPTRRAGLARKVWSLVWLFPGLAAYALSLDAAVRWLS